MQALGNRSVETEQYTRRHRGGDVAAIRLQVGLTVLASKPWAIGLLGLGLKTRKDFGQHVL